jgi:UDP-glucose 4-epimerase
VAISCRRLLAGEAPVIRGDGLQTRDFVFVLDVVAANLLAAGGAGDGAINIGTGVETSVAGVVAELMRVAGSHAQPEYVAAPPGEVRNGCLDVTRAPAALGWSPSTALAEGLSLTYRSFAEVEPAQPAS